MNRWEGQRIGGSGVKRERAATDGAGLQRPAFRELRSKPGRLQLTRQKAQTHHRQRSIVTTVSDVTTPYTISVPSSAGNVKGEGGSDEEEVSESETSSSSDDSDDSESRRLSSPIEKATQCSTTPVSSKKHEDLDSDEWYSESEANWTITPYSKEVTPSQPCSLVEDEEETTKYTHKEPISDKNNSQQTSKMAGNKLPVQQIPVTETASQKGDITETR